LVSEWKNNLSIRQYTILGLTFIAAILSKEMSVTLSLLMFALAFYNQQTKNVRSFTNVLLKLSPFFAVTCIYTFIRIFMWSKLTGDITGYTNYSVLHVISNYLTWCFGLIYPFDLYRAQDLMIENPWVFSSIVVFFAFTILSILVIIYGRKLTLVHKSFWLWTALIWIGITLLPICGGNPHRWYLYIPSFGLSILMAAAVDAVNQNKQKILITLCLFLLIIYSIEDFRLSTIWRKQSDLTAEFLKQIETENIYKKERIYFANIPFGYKSSYLFTLSSLQEAIQYNFGQSPDIVTVSYVNMDDDIKISSSINATDINFKMTPNHYNFFLLSATERRFSSLEVKNRENALVKINAIAKNKKISDYSVTIPKEIRSDFYYFDGKKIKSAYDIGP